MTDAVDVAIVGAGLAGLAAADALTAIGASIKVIEARDRVGGRVFTKQLHEQTVDVGGQWLAPNHKRMLGLVKRFGLSTFKTHTAGDKTLDLRGRVSRYSGLVPKMSPLELLNMHLMLRRVEKLAQEISPVEPWIHGQARAYDHETVDSWRRRYSKNERVLGAMDAGLRTIFGAEAGEISLLHFLHYVRSGGTFESLLSTEGGHQQDRIEGGAQRVAQALAATLGENDIQLNATVEAITNDDGGVCLHHTFGKLKARRVIIALPPHLAGRLLDHVSVPTLKSQLLQRYPMGATVKCLAFYSTPFWRAKGLSGEVGCTDGPISAAFDNSPKDGNTGCIVAFVVGGPARGWSERPQSMRQAAVLDALGRWLGPAAREPLGYHEEDWALSPFSGGCPIANPVPGTLSAFGRTLRDPVGCLHFAGTETAREHTGYMEGAIESGRRAADEVQGAL